MAFSTTLALAVVSLVALIMFAQNMFALRSMIKTLRHRTGYLVTSIVPEAISGDQQYPQYASSCILCRKSNTVVYIDSEGRMECQQPLHKGDIILCLDNGAVFSVTAFGRFSRENGDAYILICKAYLINTNPCVLDIPSSELADHTSPLLIRCVLPTFDYVSKSMMYSQKKEHSREAA